MSAPDSWICSEICKAQQSKNRLLTTEIQEIWKKQTDTIIINPFVLYVILLKVWLTYN